MPVFFRRTHTGTAMRARCCAVTLLVLALFLTCALGSSAEFILNSWHEPMSMPACTMPCAIPSQARIGRPPSTPMKVSVSWSLANEGTACIGCCPQCCRLSSRSLLCHRVAREGYHYHLAVTTTRSYGLPRCFCWSNELQSTPIPTSSRAIQTADSSLHSSTLVQLMLKLPCLAQSRKCCSRSHSQLMSCCRRAATCVYLFTQDIRYVVTDALPFNALLDTAI